MSVIAEGIHSANDLVASLIAFFSVRKANQPADVRHAYGHGKFESLSGTIEALLIVVVALAVAYAAVRALVMGEHEGIDHGPAVLVMGVSMVVNIVISSHLYRVAHKHESLALEADAAHLRTDVWTSGAVLAGLGTIWLVERWGREALWIDPALALLVAGLIMTQGTRIARDGLNQLLDRSLPEEEIARIAAKIQEHAGDFVEFHKLRSRRAGYERHLDLHLVVCDGLTVAQAHELTDHLEAEIASLYPHAQVMIHVEPCRAEECRLPGHVADPEACPARPPTDEPRAETGDAGHARDS